MKPFWDQYKMNPTDKQNVNQTKQKIYNCLQQLRNPSSVEQIRVSLGKDTVDHLEATLNEMVDNGDLVLIKPYSLGRPVYWIVKR